MSDGSSQMTETEFRQEVLSVYNRISKAFDDVDPDEAECEESLGTVTILLPGGAKWILSTQPPVRQLWLAVASLGRAFHFNFDASDGVWRDDKGEGIELFSYLEGLLADQAGVTIRI